MNLAMNHGFSCWSKPVPLSIKVVNYDLYKEAHTQYGCSFGEEQQIQPPHGSLNITATTK